MSSEKDSLRTTERKRANRAQVYTVTLEEVILWDIFFDNKKAKLKA